MEGFILLLAAIVLYGLISGWKRYHDLMAYDDATLAAMRRDT